MILNTQAVIDAQRADWNRVAGGWDKWDWKLNERTGFVNHLLVGFAQLRRGQQVLDLGSGTGYPALLAGEIVGKTGRVVGLDLAQEMVAVARRRAAEADLSHVEFRTADITVLTEPHASFDAVISRFCVMFLPDIPQALAQVSRVLKPGGHFCAAVWSLPDRNPHISLAAQVVRGLLNMPPPDPEQPGIFHLAPPGKLASLVLAARFKVVADLEVPTEAVWDSADEYFASLMEIAAPIQTLFSQLTPEQKKEAETEIKRRADRHVHNGKLILPAEVRVLTARKN